MELLLPYLGVIDEEDGNEQDHCEAEDNEDPPRVEHDEQGDEEDQQVEQDRKQPWQQIQLVSGL